MRQAGTNIGLLNCIQGQLMKEEAYMPCVVLQPFSSKREKVLRRLAAEQSTCLGGCLLKEIVASIRT